MTKYLLLFLGAICFVTNNTSAQSPFQLVLKTPADTTITAMVLHYVQEGKKMKVKGRKSKGIITFQNTISYTSISNLELVRRKGSTLIENFSLIEPNVEVSTDATAGFGELTFTGSEEQADFTAYKKFYTPIYNRYTLAGDSMLYYSNIEDNNKVFQYADSRKRTGDTLRYLQEAFFNAKPYSLVAGLMLSTYLTQDWKSISKALAYYEALPNKTRKHPDVASAYQGLKKLALFAPGKAFPRFQLLTPDHKEVTLDALKGKYVLFIFWSSSNQHYRQEIPFLKLAYEQFKEKGFEIVGVSMDKDITSWNSAIKKDRQGWINVLDKNGELAKSMNVDELPRNFLMSPEGKIISSGLKEAMLIEELQNAFAAKKG